MLTAVADTRDRAFPSEAPPVPLDEATGSDAFERLRVEAIAAFEAGRLEESANLLEEALDLAEGQDDPRRVDLAFCNLFGVRLSLDRQVAVTPDVMTRLREILLRNQDMTNCRLAAYNLARAYEHLKETRKGLFYARIAFDRSQLLERRDWVASSHNQIGSFLLAQSFFDEAAAEYEEALSVHPETSALRRALLEGNLGYCSVVRGDLDRGFELLYKSLRGLRRLEARPEQAVAHVDLCYAHLEAGRPADAIRHGNRALELAEEFGETDALKNALYLLGEASDLVGDDVTARACFTRLQEEFYPGSPFIPELLLTVNVRGMINLRA